MTARLTESLVLSSDISAALARLTDCATVVAEMDAFPTEWAAFMSGEARAAAARGDAGADPSELFRATAQALHRHKLALETLRGRTEATTTGLTVVESEISDSLTVRRMVLAFVGTIGALALFALGATIRDHYDERAATTRQSALAAATATSKAETWVSGVAFDVPALGRSSTGAVQVPSLTIDPQMGTIRVNFWTLSIPGAETPAETFLSTLSGGVEPSAMHWTELADGGHSGWFEFPAEPFATEEGLEFVYGGKPAYAVSLPDVRAYFP